LAFETDFHYLHLIASNLVKEACDTSGAEWSFRTNLIDYLIDFS
jgi:hypothetical protein